MSSTIPFPPLEQLCNRYCSNKQQQVGREEEGTSSNRPELGGLSYRYYQQFLAKMSIGADVLGESGIMTGVY
jgi:hypothetical protein